MPERAGGHRRVAADDDHALGRAVAVPHVAAEAPGEVLDVVLRGLVADRQPQRHRGVVRCLGHAEHVVEDLARVGEERRAEGADVGHGARRGEALAGRDRGAGVHGGRPAREERGRVEEGERRVDDVVGGQVGDAGDVGARAPDPTLRAAHGLGQAGRPGREDEQVQVVVGRRRHLAGDGLGRVEPSGEVGFVDHEHPLGRNARAARRRADRRGRWRSPAPGSRCGRSAGRAAHRGRSS